MHHLNKHAKDLDFCVVIPMYNEEGFVEKCVRAVCAVLETSPYRNGLVVVNDDSEDATGSILDHLSKEHPKLIVINHGRNLGYGGALRTGVEYAAQKNFDYALFMDSDLTNPPKEIPNFVSKMEEGFDVIKACRYCKNGKVVGVPIIKVLISSMGNKVAKYLFKLPLNDSTNGFRAVRVDLLSRMKISESGFSIIMEELYQAKQFTNSFCEIPSTLTCRAGDQRPSSFVYRPQVFFRYLKYPLLDYLKIRPE
jgi:dolichol-phosphate mannosyltransferase